MVFDNASQIQTVQEKVSVALQHYQSLPWLNFSNGDAWAWTGLEVAPRKDPFVLCTGLYAFQIVATSAPCSKQSSQNRRCNHNEEARLIGFGNCQAETPSTESPSKSENTPHFDAGT